MSDGLLHICTMSLAEDDPLHGKTPWPFMQRWDMRCSLEHRVYERRFDYDQTTTWEVARFARREDAELFLSVLVADREAKGIRYWPEGGGA